MSIVRYDPFRDLRTLQEEVNRLFTGNTARAFGSKQLFARFDRWAKYAPSASHANARSIFPSCCRPWSSSGFSGKFIQLWG